MIRHRVTVEPTTEPVTADELRAHLVLDSDADSVLVAGLIQTARAFAEEITGRAIPRQTIVATMDRIPLDPEPWWDGVREGIERMGRARAIELPRAAPLDAVSSFVTYDDADTAATFPTTSYLVDKSDPHQLGRVCLRNSASWPTGLRTANAVEITYTAGWADGAVPPALKRAILMMAAWLYANRGDCGAAGCATGCGCMGVLSPYILRRM